MHCRRHPDPGPGRQFRGFDRIYLDRDDHFDLKRDRFRSGDAVLRRLLAEMASLFGAHHLDHCVDGYP
ncbi:hypothetical protein D3C76_1670770 [compost metagenome]